MEFDTDLTKVHGALISLGRQNLLNSPASTKAVVDVLKEIIQHLPQDAKSKATFFMILNSQLEVSDELKNDENVGLFTLISPIIEKNYLIDYLYELNLQSCLNSVIENCPCGLTLELIDVVIKKLKQPDFHKSHYGIEHLYKFWCSIFIKIWKIKSGISLGEDSESLVIYFKDTFNLIKDVMITSLKIGGAELECFIGNHLFCFFKAVYFCLNLLKNENLENQGDEIYKLTVNLTDKFFETDERACINCVDLVFKNLPQILQHLTIDIWMSFSEHYKQENSTVSFQELIGNCIYNICEIVAHFNISPDVFQCLSALKIKPKTETDEIAEAGIDEIIAQIKKGKKNWYKALVNYSGFTEEKSIDCLLDHLDLADYEDVIEILKKLFNHMKGCDSRDINLKSIKRLFLHAVKMLPECDYPFWLEKVFENFEPDFFYNDNTRNNLVEIFNKSSTENKISNSDIVCLCMQSPFETIKKICNISIYDSKQIEFYTEFLKILKSPCKILYSAKSKQYKLLDFILLEFILFESLSNKEKKGLALLVKTLKKEELIGPEFSQILLKLVKENLESEEIEKAVHCLEILETLLESEEFDGNETVLLVCLSHILGYFSWDLESFSTAKADGRDVIENIITHRIKELKKKENNSALEWARHEILKCEEIDQAYFCDLWFLFKKKWVGNGKFYSGILALAHSHEEVDFLNDPHQIKEARSSIVLSLAMLLPIFTYKNWNSVFNKLINIHDKKSDATFEILEMFASSLYILSLNLNETSAFCFCYEHCVRCFGRLLKQSISNMNLKALQRIFDKIVIFLSAIEDKEKRKPYILILSSVLLDLIVSIWEKDETNSVKNSVEQALKILDDKNFLDIAIKRLQN